LQREVVNPWQWQDPLGFVQANALAGVERVVVCAGQVSVDGEGSTLHPGEMAAQFEQAVDNVEAVLAGAGLTLADVVRLNYYTTDVDAFLAAADRRLARLERGGCRAASTLLGVARLARPDFLIEIEATAAA
jgi:enamine deaminase RidA (YjgF/YER057c/UK114 family)